jgi:hypothetical protein
MSTEGLLKRFHADGFGRHPEKSLADDYVNSLVIDDAEIEAAGDRSRS